MSPTVRHSHALQESGCFRGNARPLSIAANLMMGSLTTTHSVSCRSEEKQNEIRTQNESEYLKICVLLWVSSLWSRQSPLDSRTLAASCRFLCLKRKRMNGIKRNTSTVTVEAVLVEWPHACVSDDVIEHHESFKLQLELTVGVFWQRLSLKLAQVEIGVFVSVNKELERTDLVGDSESSASSFSHTHTHYSVMQCGPNCGSTIVKLHSSNSKYFPKLLKHIWIKSYCLLMTSICFNSKMEVKLSDDLIFWIHSLVFIS